MVAQTRPQSVLKVFSRYGNVPYNLAKAGMTLGRIFLNLANHCCICLSCVKFAFFVPACWLGRLSFALAPIIRLLLDYTGQV